MALLQIAEPGMSTAPHQHRLAVGIDLGTTNSLVATVRHGLPEVLADAQGRALLPSVVRYRGAGVEVGHGAQAQQAGDPRNTISSVKRFMGRGVKDVAHAENLPYDFVDAPGMLQLRTVAGVKSPVEVSAEILKVLRERAEASLGGPLVGAVITVPAYFDDAQRQATRDAARLAGLNVLRLLNEPTAAALAYGLDNEAEGVFAVYDLGGGTFDVSVLRLRKGVFEVLATGGDSALGGDDFDHRLYCWILEQANLSLLAPEDQSLLTARARAAKERLSSKGKATIQARLSDGRWVNLSISAEGFASMTQHLVAKTLEATRQALRDAQLKPADVKGVVLVGGATRMPHVRKAVADLFGQAPLTNIDPDQVVALGAAMQANLLAGNRGGDDWLLLDVIPLSLGLETMGGLVEKVIPRNSTIPVARAQEFTTFKDGQTAMAIHVLQGERELVDHCRSLARFELRGIPPMVAGAARIRVTFQVDADGLLEVTAMETASAVQARVEVKPSYGLGDEDIARMLQDSMGTAEADLQARALREQQVDAQRLIEATAAALAADADLLGAAEFAEVEARLAALRAVAAGDDAEAIKAAVDALAHATEEFAARRMDRSIRAALAGRRVDEVMAR
ncbi:MAG: Fe-S protein assembly chaperone HscA [Burkholderiales bacterium]|jgi:molecular chaperone HscA|nr:Fe-S protein assembly chaperone HscA [Burkholderiales bacterium]MCA3230518.1 Fe-S protein assembly chaperone HscA [Burkholderiales bacterium]